MEQGRDDHNKCSILKCNKKSKASQEKMEAYLLDYMQQHPEITPDPPSPPPGEFQTIMEEMKRRGATTVLNRQLKLRSKYRRLVYYLHKPFMVSMVICVIFSVTSIGVCAGKAGKYRISKAKITETKIWHEDDVLCFLPFMPPTVGATDLHQDERKIKRNQKDHEINDIPEINRKITLHSSNNMLIK
jgi:hypothetical protein